MHNHKISIKHNKKLGVWLVTNNEGNVYQVSSKAHALDIARASREVVSILKKHGKIK
jgi:hypothetical protein